MSNILIPFKVEFYTKKKNGHKYLETVEIIHNCKNINNAYTDWFNRAIKLDSESFCAYLRLAGFNALTTKGFNIINNHLTNEKRTI